MSIEAEVSNSDFNELKTKIARVQQELCEIEQILDSWAGSDGVALAEQEPKDPLRNIQIADKEPLRKTFAEIFERLGIDKTQRVSQEELEIGMRESGINPEDNILSRGILEMREE